VADIRIDKKGDEQMAQIFANLKKYWIQVFIIIVLLIAQAYCDLSLPDYTSNIIDVGIANSGIEHPVPEYLTEKGFKTVNMFLTEDELKEFSDNYEKKDNYYQLKDTDDENWDKLDNEFGSVIAVIYMLTSQKNSDAEGMDFEGMQPQMMQSSKVKEQLDEMGVDITSPTLLIDIRRYFEDKISSLGNTTINSMAKQFAKEQYEQCGKDIDNLQTSYMLNVGAKMICMALLMAIIAITVGLIASRVGAGVGRDLRGKVFNKVMNFSNAELDKFSTASLITRSTNDVQQIQMVTVMLLRMVLYAPILAIGGIINIRHYRSGMSWVIVVAVIAVLFIIAVLLVIAMPKFKVMQDKVDNVNLVSREILTGLSVIRAFSREKREEERFEDANSQLTKTMLFVNRSMAFMMPAMMIVMNGVSVLIIWVGSKKIDAGVMEVGALTAFITYAMLIIMGFLMLTMISIMLPRAGVAANRIKEILDTENVIIDKENAITKEPKVATVCFNNVNFKYPDGEENVLEGIDFEAKPGQTTAIIGSTGSGKSSLVKLVPRFFDTTDGYVSVGGEDIRNYSIKTLRGMIGYVPQKGVLFSGDIKSNISFGAKDADMQQIEQAAQIAQAEEFILEKDNKYDSRISQGGSNVSGGQKQRLSIARAIARNPKIYIFDDSFSALDFKTDTALRKALAAKTKNSVVIIVAQRVSTILNADQIIVLEEGKMIGKGTHRELVENCETYRQIAQSQLSEEEFLASIGKDVTTVGKEEF